MLFLIRLILGSIIGIFISIIGILYCCLKPRNPKNVAKFAYLFGTILPPIFNIKLTIRKNVKIEKIKNCIYIANHQSNYDVLVAGQTVKPGMVTVGKRSVVYIPFFGQLYWLSGNILLNRNNKAKAYDTLTHVASEIKARDLSIWMFPEGTRSHGRGLLPFKSGAFRTAIAAGVPIVPICVSDTNNIKLKNWNNGNIIIEILDPIETSHLKKEDTKTLMNDCYQLMAKKLDEINNEAKKISN